MTEVVSAFLGELGKRLAEKWLTVLVLPGLLFGGAAALAVVLGQAHALDARLLLAEAGRRGREIQPAGTAAILAAALGVLLGAAGVGILVNAVAVPVRAWWLGRWAGPLAPLRRVLTSRRLRRWERLHSRYAVEVERREPDREIIDALAARRNRIASAPPSRPTWIGDRVAAADRRVFTEYRLDLAAAWPRLWLILPDAVRTELRMTRTAFDSAVVLAGWGVLYVALGARWWPSAVIGVATLVAAWRRGRASAAELADLAEATVDLHGVQLGVTLGLCSADSRLDADLGRRITAQLRKGA